MRGLWRAIKRTLTKIILKVFTWILLLLLIAFSALFKVSLSIFRLAAFPCGIIAVVAACFYYFESGLCREFYLLIAGIPIGIAAYFMLPKVSPILASARKRLSYYAHERVFVRSPVKYTM